MPEGMEKIRVADYVISFIYDKLGVKCIFLVSGGAVMHLTDAIACHGKINYVCSQNEQATTMQADGYAKASQGFGAALVSSGPAATNAITGVVGAYQDSTPILVVSGQSKRSQTILNSGLPTLRQFGVQEANIIPMVKSVTKYAEMVNEPEKIRYHLEKAAFLARKGRPGPVWLDIPLDVQGSLVEPEKLRGFYPGREGLLEKEDKRKLLNDASKVLSMLKISKRPVLVAGHGIRIAKAVHEFRRLVEALNVPVVTPRLGTDIIESSHPLFVGRPGIKGTRSANFAMQNSDLLLCIGTRLSVNVTGHEYEKFAREAKVIVVDIDEEEHKKKTVRIDLFLRHDALSLIKALLQIAGKEKFICGNEWPGICRKWKERYPVVLPEYSAEKPVNTYYFTEKLCQALQPHDIIVIDSGSSSYVVSQAVKIKEGQLFIASGGLGSMGYALPAAIGAAVACPDKRVVCITGDGSLHFNVQELQTLVGSRLPIKIFVFNNSGYASIWATQHNFFGDRFVGVAKESKVSLPDTLKIAELYGIKGIRIEKPEQLERGIKETMDFDGPAICDVICSIGQPVIPTAYSEKKPDGSMVSRPLEDMYPFIGRKEFLSNMIVRPCDKSR